MATSTTAGSACGGGPSRRMTARRSVYHPAASKAGRSRSPAAASAISSLRCCRPACSSSAAAIKASASGPGGRSTRTRFASQYAGTEGVRTTVPSSHGSSASQSLACWAYSQAIAARRASVVLFVLAAAGAADHDLVLFDRDLDRAVARPVLRVHRIVLDGGIEPQPVALLAMVERALERPGGRGAAARAASAAARGALGRRILVRVLGRLGVGARGRRGGGLGRGLGLGRLAGGFLGGASLLLGPAGGLRL